MKKLWDAIRSAFAELGAIARELAGVLKPWLMFAGVAIAALYIVDLWFWNVPSFSADTPTAIAGALAAWCGRG